MNYYKVSNVIAEDDLGQISGKRVEVNLVFNGTSKEIEKEYNKYINAALKQDDVQIRSGMTKKEKETLNYLYEWAKAGVFENGGSFSGDDEKTKNVEKAYKYLLKRFGGE